MRPQRRPVDELAQCLAVACGGDADWRKLRDELNGENVGPMVSDIAHDLRTKVAANEAEILLPIDQGEELFGVAEPDQAQRFFDILNETLSDDQPFLGVMAMRSDYLGKLQSADRLKVRFEEFSLGPMPLARIPQIIEGPARVAGLRVEDGFAQQAVRDAETVDALPLLAFALRALYDRGSGDHYLSLAAYNALGDAEAKLTPLENSVRKAADDVLAEAKPSDEEMAALRDAFVPAMVRVNDQGEYVRRPAKWDNLPPKSHALLERLAKARLLIVSQQGDDRIVEVAHEALLRKWPRLRAWLDEAREFLAGKQQLEVDLRDWERASEADKADALLSGLKLHRAREWLTARPQQFSDQERAYIRASIDQAEAVQLRKLRQRQNHHLGFGHGGCGACLRRGVRGPAMARGGERVPNQGVGIHTLRLGGFGCQASGGKPAHDAGETVQPKPRPFHIQSGFGYGPQCSERPSWQAAARRLRLQHLVDPGVSLSLLLDQERHKFREGSIHGEAERLPGRRAAYQGSQSRRPLSIRSLQFRFPGMAG